MSTTMPVTIIVPVYRGLTDVRRCLQSVVRHAGSSEVPFEVVAIDDASPEPELPGISRPARRPRSAASRSRWCTTPRTSASYEPSTPGFVGAAATSWCSTPTRS